MKTPVPMNGYILVEEYKEKEDPKKIVLAGAEKLNPPMGKIIAVPKVDSTASYSYMSLIETPVEPKVGDIVIYPTGVATKFYPDTTDSSKILYFIEKRFILGVISKD